MLHEHRHSEQIHDNLPFSLAHTHSGSYEDILDQGFTEQEIQDALSYVNYIANLEQPSKYIQNLLDNYPKFLDHEFDAELHARHRLNKLNKWLATNQPGKYQTPTMIPNKPYGYLISDFARAYGMEDTQLDYEILLEELTSEGPPDITPSPWDTNTYNTF